LTINYRWFNHRCETQVYCGRGFGPCLHREHFADELIASLFETRLHKRPHCLALAFNASNVKGPLLLRVARPSLCCLVVAAPRRPAGVVSADGGQPALTQPGGKSQVQKVFEHFEWPQIKLSAKKSSCSKQGGRTSV
jgi:hypothetical protein